MCSPTRLEDAVELCRQSGAWEPVLILRAVVASISSRESQNRAKQGKISEETFHSLRPVKRCKTQKPYVISHVVISNGKKLTKTMKVDRHDI